MSLLFVSVRIYLQNKVPRIEKTQIILLLLVSLVTFCDIVWSLSVCAWNLVETYCSYNFAPRPDGVNFYQTVFFLYYVCKFTGIFVSAVTTCDKFVCRYYETCRCPKAGPVQNPAGFHNENSMNFSRPYIDSGSSRKSPRSIESL